MALVYRARDLTLDRDIAVKLLREDYSTNPTFRDRFRQEARAAAGLTHNNIVTVHDFGWDQGYLFIIMELVPGTDLKSLIRTRKRFSLQDTLALMIQACQGVGYAHRAGLVHCDIKPHNFLVSPDGLLKVTDFGIARALASISPDEHNETIWGSPHYFSPEQAAGLPPSPASDVYSLGVILYEMLAGRLPFQSNDATELGRKHREEPPTPPRTFNPEIPAKLEEIILKTLAKEPSARYRNADQLGLILQGFLENTLSYPKNDRKFCQIFDPVHNTKADSDSSPQNSSPLGSHTTAERIRKFLDRLPERQDTSDSHEEQQDDNTKADTNLWLLGFTAMVFLLGLIPFWFYVYLTLKP